MRLSSGNASGFLPKLGAEPYADGNDNYGSNNIQIK